MKKLSLIAMVLMVGYIMGSVSLNDVSAAKKDSRVIAVCLPGLDCFEYRTTQPPGFAKQVVTMIQEVFENAQHQLVVMVEEVTYAAVEKYMVEHPCECASQSSGSTDGIATFPAIYPPVFTGELSGLWAPPNHIVQDTKTDMWLETNVNDEKYFIPLFR